MTVNYSAASARRQSLNKQVNLFQSLLGYRPKTVSYTVKSLAGGGFIRDDKAGAYGVDPKRLGYYVELLDKHNIKIGDITEGRIVTEFKPESRIQQSGGGNTIYTKTVTTYKPVYEQGKATDRANLAMLAINEAKRRDAESNKKELESELGINLEESFKEREEDDLSTEGTLKDYRNQLEDDLKDYFLIEFPFHQLNLFFLFLK